MQAGLGRSQVESLAVMTWGDHMVKSVMEAQGEEEASPGLASFVRLGHIHMGGEEVGCQHFRLGS